MVKKILDILENMGITMNKGDIYSDQVWYKDRDSDSGKEHEFLWPEGKNDRMLELIIKRNAILTANVIKNNNITKYGLMVIDNPRTHIYYNYSEESFSDLDYAKIVNTIAELIN